MGLRGAGGVLGEEGAEDDEALSLGAEGDHAAVPQGAVEPREAGFGVALAVVAFAGGGGDADGLGGPRGQRMVSRWYQRWVCVLARR